MLKTFTVLAALVLLTTSAQANGTSKKQVYREGTIQAYEPRQPLISLGVLGHNLVIWEDLRIETNLFDDERDRRRYRRSR